MIVEAQSSAELDQVRALFREYAAIPDVGVCVQGFEEEIAGLPGVYAEPRGLLLLARIGGQPAGCVAIKPVASDVAELKRLFVRPDYRGHRVGESLAQAAIDTARARGYRRLRLDTLPSMVAAHAVYQRLGFLRVAAWADPPIAGASYLERTL